MGGMMRIRIEGKGPEAWRYTVVDAETGRVLPAKSVAFSLSAESGYAEAVITVVVAEVEIEIAAERREEVMRIKDYLSGAHIDTREVG